MTMATSATAHAADNTFKATFKFDKTASVENNYSAFRDQARLACRAEKERAGWRRTESSTGQQRKCERQIMSKAIKATKSPMMAALHNQTIEGKIDIIKLAQK